MRGDREQGAGTGREMYIISYPLPITYSPSFIFKFKKLTGEYKYKCCSQSEALIFECENTVLAAMAHRCPEKSPVSETEKGDRNAIQIRRNNNLKDLV